MSAEKARIRREVHASVKEWGKQARAAASKSVCAQLSPILRNGETVLAFWPITSTEPDLRPALTLAIINGVQVCLPRTDGTTLFAHKTDEFENLSLAKLGAREPVESIHPEVDVSEIDLVLVPGVAFTCDGIRLGRGGGHYDRFLARLSPHTRLVGVAFSKQIREQLPVEPHDVRVGEVITD